MAVAKLAPKLDGELHSPIVELRHYTLHPGRRDDLISLFDTYFVEGQESCGMKIIGHGLEKSGRMFCCDHCAEKRRSSAAIGRSNSLLLVSNSRTSDRMRAIVRSPMTCSPAMHSRSRA